MPPRRRSPTEKAKDAARQRARRQANPDLAQKQREANRAYKKARRANGGQPLGRRTLTDKVRQERIEARRKHARQRMREKRSVVPPISEKDREKTVREKDRESARRYAAKNRELLRQKRRLMRRKFAADGRGKVYFVQVTSGPIKIGYTTKTMAGRMQELQCGNHEVLTLLKATLASRFEETRFHDQFASARIRGEWFQPTQEMLDVIATLPDLPEISSPIS